MHAAFILLLVTAIAGASWLAAWRNTREPDHLIRREEATRLRNQALWLEQRLDTARRERWDPTMIVTLSQQLGIACRQLAQAELRAQNRAVTRAHSTGR